MRASQRNAALLQYVVALGMTAILAYFVVKYRQRMLSGNISEEWMALGLLFYFVTIVAWMFASFTLAKAKGHSSDKTGCIFVFFFLAGFLLPFIPLLFPLYVIFGMEDLEKRRRW